MSDVARLLLLLVLVGGILTVLGMATVWLRNDERRIRSSLKHVLGAAPEAMVAAHGRGAGFAFSRGTMAVTWDQGAWCLTYRIAELVGAEVIVDGEVLGRAHRGEARRAIDRSMTGAGEVILRLLFDDPGHPDFDITLWSETAEPRKGVASPALAGQEGNRWLARAESILRRQGAAPAPAPQPAKPAPAADPPPQAARNDDAARLPQDDETPF